MSVPETLRSLDAARLRELREYAAADEQSSPAARQRLAEHIDREQQRRTGR